MEKKSRTSQLDHERKSKLAALSAGLNLMEAVKARIDGRPSTVALTIVGRNFAAEARFDTYQWLNEGKPRPDACAAPAKWVLSSHYSKEASAYPNATDALAAELAATLAKLWPSWEMAEERLTYVGSLELKEDAMREQFRPGSKLASLEVTPREVLESEWDGADAGELKGGEPLYQAFVDTTPNADETMLVHDEALAVVLESTGDAGAATAKKFRSESRGRWDTLKKATERETTTIELARASFARLSALLESGAEEANEWGPAWIEDKKLRDDAERAFTERQEAEHELWRRWVEPTRWRDKKVWQDSDVWGGDGPPYPIFVVTLAHAVWHDVVRPRLEREHERALVPVRMPTEVARSMAQARAFGGRLQVIDRGLVLVEPPRGLALSLPFDEELRVSRKSGDVVGLRQVLTPHALRTYLATLLLYQDAGSRDDGSFEFDGESAVLDVTGATKHEEKKKGRSYFRFATKDTKQVRDHLELFSRMRVRVVGELEMREGDPLLDEVRDRRSGKTVCYAHARLIAARLKNDYVRIPRAVCKLSPGDVPLGIGMAMLVRRKVLAFKKSAKPIEAPLSDWLAAAGINGAEGARKTGRSFWDEQVADIARVAEEAKLGTVSSLGSGRDAVLTLAVAQDLADSYAPLLDASKNQEKAKRAALTQDKRRPK